GSLRLRTCLQLPRSSSSGSRPGFPAPAPRSPVTVITSTRPFPPLPSPDSAGSPSTGWSTRCSAPRWVTVSTPSPSRRKQWSTSHEQRDESDARSHQERNRREPRDPVHERHAGAAGLRFLGPDGRGLAVIAPTIRRRGHLARSPYPPRAVPAVQLAHYSAAVHRP